MFFMLYLIFFLLWVAFALILGNFVSAISGDFKSFPKKLLYWILVLPILWIDLVASRTYRGTVGGWFLALADWLKS